MRRLRGFMREDPLRPFPAMETLIICVIALGLLAYLVFAVLRPEKF